MPSLLTFPEPIEGNSGNGILSNWYNQYASPLTPDNWLWYNTGGPTLEGMPTPGGMACSIQQGATYRPGVRCSNIVDAWKIYNALGDINTPALAASTGSTGWKTKINAEKRQRIFNHNVWSVWNPGSPQHVMAGYEIPTWPVGFPPDVTGDLAATLESDQTVVRYNLLGPWYIEKDTGAVYLDFTISLGGTYVRGIGGQHQTLLINAKMGKTQYVRSGTNPSVVRNITWSTTIAGIPVECLATYWCWSPKTVPVPVISQVENWYKGIQFGSL